MSGFRLLLLGVMLALSAISMSARAAVVTTETRVSPEVRLAAPPVYLNDPGLVGLAVRPEYILVKPPTQTLQWIRSIRWSSWGAERARGRGLYEICSFGKCERSPTDVILSRRIPLDCSTGSSYTRITYWARGRATSVPADAYVCEDD